MKKIQLGDGEYYLMLEERLREYIPAEISYGIEDDGSKFAGIIIQQQIENKYLYGNANSTVIWEAAQNGMNIEKIFLDMIFRDDESVKLGEMHFYFDIKDSNFRKHMIEWFTMIIEKNGIIGLFDNTDPSIMINNIPLDMPKLIIATKGEVGNVI